MLACLNDYADIVALLLDYNADVNIKDNEGLLAVYCNHFKRMRNVG